MTRLLRSVRARVPNVLLGVIIGLLVGGASFAVATAVTDDGPHGGPKPRFHDAGECNLVDVSTLPGNWTHGDYVSAVEKSDPSKVREAAHSRCGKPIKGGPKGPKDKQKGKDDPASGAPKSSKPSPKPSHSKEPSPTPSATGTASPADPEETPSLTESASPSPTPSSSST